jgi:hypothetical protein
VSICKTPGIFENAEVSCVPFIFALYSPSEKEEASIMRTSTTVQPGHRGAKKFLAQYGDRLVCVRYRSDEQRQKRLKTIELIVEEWPWATQPPRDRAERVVLVKVAFAERELRQQVKEAGGVWSPDQQAWALRYDQVLTLGLQARIVHNSCS